MDLLSSDDDRRHSIPLPLYPLFLPFPFPCFFSNRVGLCPVPSNPWESPGITSACLAFSKNSPELLVLDPQKFVGRDPPPTGGRPSPA